MSNTTAQSTTCKSVCWLLGMAAGGYLTYFLIYVQGQDRVQSGVIGIVSMLIVGLILRRLLCRRKPAAVAETPKQQSAAKQALSQAEARAQTAATPRRPASPAQAPAAMAETLHAKSRDALKSEIRQEAAARKPAAPVAEAEVDSRLTERIMAAARASAEPLALRPEQAVAKAPEPVAADPDPSDEEASVEELYDWDAEEEAEFEALTKAEAVKDAPEAEPEMAEAKPVRAAEPEPAEQAEPETAIVPPSRPVSETPKQTEPQAIPESALRPEPVVKAAPRPVETASDEVVPDIKPLEPKGLDAPDGTPDDLTQIEGLTAAQMAAMNTAGIYHFAQFVTMNRRELAWLDQNLPGIAEAGTAETWRKQAIALSRQAG